MSRKGKSKGKKSRGTGGDDDHSPRKQKGRHKKNRAVISNANDFRFRQSLEGGSRTIINISADGNCLFRSISDQLYYDHGRMHDEIRSDICDYLEANEDDFSVFLVLDENEEDEDAASFDAYISTMREDGEWGGNLELVAGARLYRRNITVFSTLGAAFTIEHGQEKTTGTDLMVSYHDNDHYNSIRDNSLPYPPLPSKFLTNKDVHTLEVDQENDDLTKEEDCGKGTDEENGTMDDEEDKKEVVVENAWAPKVTDNTDSMKTKTRATKGKDPCPCKSGLRYKKCCQAKDKSIERSKKIMETKNGTEESDDSSEEETVLDGNFKVLRI